jgi:hypothetical protein
VPQNVFKINMDENNGSTYSLQLVLTTCITEKAIVGLNTSDISFKVCLPNKPGQGRKLTKKIQFHQLPSSLLSTQWCSLSS